MYKLTNTLNCNRSVLTEIMKDVDSREHLIQEMIEGMPFEAPQHIIGALATQDIGCKLVKIQVITIAEQPKYTWTATPPHMP